MMVWEFETLAKTLLERSGHEQVKTVRTFAEAGLPKPAGLEVTCRDGYTYLVQFVGGSAPSGDTRSDAEQTAERERRDDPSARQFRPLDEHRRGSGRPPPPELKVRNLERLIRDVVAGAARPDVAQVATYAEAGIKTVKPAGVRVTFTDGSEAYAMFLSVLPPGADRPSHPEFDPPKEWL